MKYIKKFQTNADYQTYKGSSDYVTPNVSLVTGNKELFYNKKEITIIRFHTVQTIYNIKTSHTALSGMTWNDWINSEYYTRSVDGNFRDQFGNGSVVIEDSTLKNSNDEFVYFTDTIIPDETYTYRGTR